MITLNGKGVFGGIAIGKLAFYKRNSRQVKRWHVENSDSEVTRFTTAKEKAVIQLSDLYEKAIKNVRILTLNGQDETIAVNGYEFTKTISLTDNTIYEIVTTYNDGTKPNVDIRINNQQEFFDKTDGKSFGKQIRK